MSASAFLLSSRGGMGRLLAGLLLSAAALQTAYAAPKHDAAAEHKAAQSRHSSGAHGPHGGGAMLTYRFMRMSMAGSLNGQRRQSSTAIATTELNPFSDQPMQPPTLRVVPRSMTVDMHGFGLMYALTERVSLAAMTGFVEKTMDHVTFSGPTGDVVLGRFTTNTSGVADTRVSALIQLVSRPAWRIQARLGLSLPTASIDERDEVLTPAGARRQSQLPYPMQLGSGTVDALLGLTFAGDLGALGWESQWQSVVRLGENDAGYALGDEHEVSATLSYRLTDPLKLHARLRYFDRGNVDGADPRIQAPVQTADPQRQGAERLDFGLGLAWSPSGGRRQVTLEAYRPVQQNLDGPQLETDWSLALGVRVGL
ncbi:MAG: transporter [Pseudomonadota bacterium]